MEKKQAIRHFSDTQTWQQKVLFCLLVLGRASGYLLLYFFVPAVFLAIGYVGFNQHMDVATFFTYGGSIYTAMGMVASLWFLHRKAKKQNRSLIAGIPALRDKIFAEKSILMCIFGITCALTLSATLSLIGQIPVLENLLTGYTVASQNMYRGYDVFVAIISTVLLAPLVEEVIFRGYILDILLERFDDRTALWVVSIGFALCHINGIWAVYALGMGFVLSYVSVREDGIYYSLLCHVGFNLPSAVIFVINTTLPQTLTVTTHPVFLLVVGVPCGLCALWLGRYYMRQNANSYCSIFSKWRAQP